jgi:predicted metal-dependent phosphoesterase TrpH
MVRMKTMILKTNLHLHTKEDENNIISYDVYQYIDRAKDAGFDVLAYTPHRKFLFKKEYAEYAESKRILLIPGMELSIRKKHVVVLNCSPEAENIKNFQDLANYKDKHPESLILAPHPFVFNPKSLNSKLLENIGLFDAVEMTLFSNKLFNFNKKAEKTTKKYGLPFIATSDTHFINDLERGYSLVEAEEKTIEAVFSAIKNKKFQNESRSFSTWDMVKHEIKGGLNLIFGPNTCR